MRFSAWSALASCNALPSAAVRIRVPEASCQRNQVPASFSNVPVQSRNPNPVPGKTSGERGAYVPLEVRS